MQHQADGICYAVPHGGVLLIRRPAAIDANKIQLIRKRTVAALLAACASTPVDRAAFHVVTGHEMSAYVTHEQCMHVTHGERLEWDAENLKVKNTTKADAFLQREYRKGWTL